MPTEAEIEEAVVSPWRSALRLLLGLCPCGWVELLVEVVEIEDEEQSGCNGSVG
jgi:hypothetical protein